VLDNDIQKKVLCILREKNTWKAVWVNGFNIKTDNGKILFGKVSVSLGYSGVVVVVLTESPSNCGFFFSIISLKVTESFREIALVEMTNQSTNDTNSRSCKHRMEIF